MTTRKHGLAEEVEGWSEANRRLAVTGAEWASRRSEAEGLGVMWYARSRETTCYGKLASEYIGHVVSARSADHITERQAHAAGTSYESAGRQFVCLPRTLVHYPIYPAVQSIQLLLVHYHLTGHLGSWSYSIRCA